MTDDSITEQAAPTGRDVYEENGWGGCEGASWDRLSPATQDGWEFAARVLAHQAPATEALLDQLDATLDATGDALTEFDRVNARVCLATLRRTMRA